MSEETTTTITKELAEQEFSNYCAANRFDADESAMSDEDKADFLPIKNRFVEATMAGRVTVDGKKVVYTISDESPAGFSGDKVTVIRPNGAAMMAMDGYKDTQNIRKLQAFMSAIVGKEIQYFAKLDIEDWMFFQGIATLFLSA
jgi:hypothetical protein